MKECLENRRFSIENQRIQLKIKLPVSELKIKGFHLKVKGIQFKMDVPVLLPQKPQVAPRSYIHSMQALCLLTWLIWSNENRLNATKDQGVPLASLQVWNFEHCWLSSCLDLTTTMNSRAIMCFRAHVDRMSVQALDCWSTQLVCLGS